MGSNLKCRGEAGVWGNWDGELGARGGGEAYVREPCLVIAFGHGSRNFEKDS